MKYIVLVREVHVSHREIEADSEDEAKSKVYGGQGEETYLEYSHTLDRWYWTVEAAKDQRSGPPESGVRRKG